MKKILLLYLCCALSVTLLSQDNTTSILSPTLRTLRVRMMNKSSLVRPVLFLPTEGVIDGSDPDNTLEISFDELSHDVHMYTYTVRHLNGDWHTSELQSYEYVRGFTTADITDYEHSINTQINYTHYSFTFPNEDMRLIHSGLFLIQIYEDADPEHVVAQQIVTVVEPKVTIDIDVRANTILELNGHYQQLDINADTRHLDLTNPQDIHLMVSQNGRYDNRVYNIKPNYIENNHLRWSDNKDLIYEGGNEYHRFDAYSTYFAGTNIDYIDYAEGEYQCFLFPDDNKTYIYIHDFDADGQYVINAERTDDADVEAEYMRVHFFLRSEPMLDGIVYIGGDMFLNRMSASNRMVYDYDAGGYYMNTLLKQGGYNYQYWFMPKRSLAPEGLGLKGATLRRTEGSHWQTGNTYEAYLFYRPFGARADRLVGYSSSSK